MLRKIEHQRFYDKQSINAKSKSIQLLLIEQLLSLRSCVGCHGGDHDEQMEKVPSKEKVMTSTEMDREQCVSTVTHTFCLEGQAGLGEGGASVLERGQDSGRREGPEALQAGWWGWRDSGHTGACPGGQVGVLPLRQNGRSRDAIRMTLWRALDQQWDTCHSLQ